jgi:hypothetical protein
MMPPANWLAGQLATGQNRIGEKILLWPVASGQLTRWPK